MKINELNVTEYDSYYQKYIDKVENNIELTYGFKSGNQKIINFFSLIPHEKLNHRYLPDKWSIKEVLQHIIDTERIFMHRCFRIARGDKTPLAGYEQNDYIFSSGSKNKTIDDLINEYSIVRQGSISLLNSLTNVNLGNLGEANGSIISARAAAFIILGHEIWHMDIIKELYL